MRRRCLAAGLVLSLPSVLAAQGVAIRAATNLEPAEVRARWTFESEAKRAAKDLGLPAPQVIVLRETAGLPFRVPPTTAAFVWPREGTSTVVVLPRGLAWGDREVRCFARHELAHLQLGHRGACVRLPGSAECDPERSSALLEQHHQEVAALMAATWGDRLRCGAD